MAASPVDALIARLGALQDEVQQLIHQTSYQIAQNPKAFRRGGAAKIRAAQRTLLAEIDQLTAESQRFFEGDFNEAFRMGAQRGGRGRYNFTAQDLGVLERLSTTSMNDIRVNNELAKRSTRSVMGDLATMKPEKITKQLLRERVGKGMQWRDGRRYGVGHYNKMVTQAATQRAYNAGTILANQERGIKAFLVSDGPDCGWTSHNDPQGANGLKVSAEDALGHLLAHPYCKRTFKPLKGEEEPGPIGVRIGRKALALFPDITGPAAAGVAAGLGLGAAFTLNAALRKRLIDVAMRTNPYRLAFTARMQQIVDEMFRRGIAEVVDIRTGLPLKVTLETLREDIATYADQAVEGLGELPEHVRHVLGVGFHESKKVVGDSFEHFMEFVGLEREASATSQVIPFMDEIVRDFGQGEIKFQPQKWVSIPIPPKGGQLYRFHFPQPPGFATLGGRLRVTLPQLGQRFISSRALRIAFQPNRWVKVTGTARASWTAFREEGVHIWEATKFIPHIRLNPNGLLRAGFSFADGKILPSLSAVGKGPIRLFTKLNPGGSLSTTVRLVTRGWFNFSVSTNLKMDVIKEAMKNYGLLDIKEFTSLEKIHKQFQLARTALRQQMGNLSWSDFNVRSLAAELHIYGFSVFDIARTFRIKWEDALTLLHRAQEFMGGQLHRASLYHQRVRYGGQVLELSTSLLKRYRNTSEEGILADIEALRPKRPSVEQIRAMVERDVARGVLRAEDVELTIAMRIEELSQTADEMLINHQAMWDDVKRTVHMHETRYPRATKLILKLKSPPDIGPQAWAHYDPEDKSIGIRKIFRDRYLRDTSTPEAIVPDGGLFMKNVRAGGLVAYEDQAGTLVHEIGHQLHYGLNRNELTELWRRIQATPGWQRVYNIESRELMRPDGIAVDDLLKAMSEEMRHNEAFIQEQLSVYATENVVEFVAEGFGQFMYAPGRGSPIAETVGKFFDETFGSTAPDRKGIKTWYDDLVEKFPELRRRGMLPEMGPDPDEAGRLWAAMAEEFAPAESTLDLLQDAGLLDNVMTDVSGAIVKPPKMDRTYTDWVLKIAKGIDDGSVVSTQTGGQYLAGVLEQEFGVTHGSLADGIEALAAHHGPILKMRPEEFFSYAHRLEQWLEVNGTHTLRALAPEPPLPGGFAAKALDLHRALMDVQFGDNFLEESINLFATQGADAIGVSVNEFLDALATTFPNNSVGEVATNAAVAFDPGHLSQILSQVKNEIDHQAGVQEAIRALIPGLIDDATVSLYKDLSFPTGVDRQAVKEIMAFDAADEQLKLLRQYLEITIPDITDKDVYDVISTTFGIDEWVDHSDLLVAKWEQFFGGTIEQMEAKVKLTARALELKIEEKNAYYVGLSPIKEWSAGNYVTIWNSADPIDKGRLAQTLALDLGVSEEELFQLYVDAVSKPQGFTDPEAWFFGTADYKMFGTPFNFMKAVGKMQEKKAAKAWAVRTASSGNGASETLREQFHNLLKRPARAWRDLMDRMGRQRWIEALQTYTTSAYNVVNAHLRGQLYPGGTVGTYSAEQTVAKKAPSLPRYIRDEYQLDPLIEKVIEGEDLTFAEWTKMNHANAAWADDISAAISEHAAVPEDIIVWRGADPGMLPTDEFGVPLSNEDLPGWVLKDEGFSSTSISRSFARNWTGHHRTEGRLLLEIHIPKGSKGVAYLHHVSSLQNEWEVLLDRGRRFKILETKWDPTDPDLRIAIVELLNE